MKIVYVSILLCMHNAYASEQRPPLRRTNTVVLMHPDTDSDIEDAQAQAAELRNAQLAVIASAIAQPSPIHLPTVNNIPDTLHSPTSPLFPAEPTAETNEPTNDSLTELLAAILDQRRLAGSESGYESDDEGE